jgi:opacity protein-like surface antigen
MFSRKLITAVLALLLATAGIAAIAMTPPDASAQAGQLRCDIEVEDFGGSVRLQGVVFSLRGAEGVYDLLVSGAESGQRPDIRQQGDFTAGGAYPMRLGIVELRKDSRGYNAVLTLIWNGAEYRCVKRIGEAWS